MANTNLTKAKSAKNDEFYTRMGDIAVELAHYKDQFKGKVIFCGCDDHKKSNFPKFFIQNFNALGIKLLVCSGVENASTMKGSYVEFDGTKETIIEDCDGTFQTNIPKVVEKYGAENVVFVTNPPFSLFRKLISTIEAYHIKYLVIGNMNAITYKDCFKLIKEEKMFLGYGDRSLKMWFVSSPVEKSVTSNWKLQTDGTWLVGVTGTVWFTNLKVDVASKCAMAKFRFVESYYALSEEERNEKYPKYDNYDAINIDKCKDIPGDYFGEIGVPISFLYYLDPTVWDVIGHEHDIRGGDVGQFEVNGKGKYKRIIIKRKPIK